MEDYIKMNDLVDKGIYEIDGRNASVGIWSKSGAFFIIRKAGFFKGDEHLFREDHWDVGAPYGTAKPLKLIEVLPDSVDLEDHRFILDKLLKCYESLHKDL